VEPFRVIQILEKIFTAPCVAGLHRTGQENPMSPSTHDRIAELHSLAEHAHAAAAEAHGKGEHRTAHELSKRALEHSMNAYKLSAQQAEEAEKVARS
jgi:uncharacterized protein (DUF849 family)